MHWRCWGPFSNTVGRWLAFLWRSLLDSKWSLTCFRHWPTSSPGCLPSRLVSSIPRFQLHSSWGVNLSRCSRSTSHLFPFSYSWLSVCGDLNKKSSNNSSRLTSNHDVISPIPAGAKLEQILSEPEGIFAFIHWGTYRNPPGIDESITLAGKRGNTELATPSKAVIPSWIKETLIQTE